MLKLNSSAFSIAEVIGQDIVSGQLFSDAQYQKEIDLCEKYQVSRSVMRESVKILVGKGLVRSRQNRGLTRTSLAEWNIFDEDVIDWLLMCDDNQELMREIDEFRVAIESGVLAQLTSSGAELRNLVLALNDCLRVMQESVNDSMTFAHSSMQFHICILEQSSNRFSKSFALLLRRMTRGEKIARQLRRATKLDPHLVLEKHQKMVDFLLKAGPSASIIQYRELLLQNGSYFSA